MVKFPKRNASGCPDPTAHDALLPIAQADAALEIICSEPGMPLVYRRGSLLCVVNPEGRELEMALPADAAGKLQGEVLLGIGNVNAEGGRIRAGAQSFAVIR